MKQPKRRALRSQILVTFMLQIGMISFAAVIGLFITNYLLVNVLVEEALKREADHYWQLLERQPDATMANSLNLTGYLLPRDQEQFPFELTSIQPGLHKLESERFNLYHLTVKDDQTLLLLFNHAGVNSLIAFYGVLPLAIVLLVLYVSLWVGYRFTARAISPAVMLATAVSELDAKHPDPKTISPQILPAYADNDVVTLAEVLEKYIERNEAFRQRERAFTRDASHELRTPITVIKMATSVLKGLPPISPNQTKLVEKIDRATSDMTELTDAFLTLARESDMSLDVSWISVNKAVDELVEQLAPMASAKGLELKVKHVADTGFEGSAAALKIVLSNIIRNAINYTEQGYAEVLVYERRVEVRDTGPGISEQKLGSVFELWARDHEHTKSGYGVGLSIVRRLCDQSDWTIRLDSKKNVGTIVTLEF